MIKLYSFMGRGRYSKDEVREYIQKTEKDIVFTEGLGYRNPTTNKAPISKEKALSILKRRGTVDVNEYDKYIEINAFNGNDLF